MRAGCISRATGDYEYHVKTYGHPSKFGFMEIDNLWKAEKWDPERLIALYKRAGANTSSPWPIITTIGHVRFDVPCVELGECRAEEGHRGNLGEGRARERTALGRDQSLVVGDPAGCSPPMATTAKVRWRASVTTLTRSPKRTAKASGGMGSTRRISIRATASKCPTASTAPRPMRAWYQANTSLAKSNPMPADAFCENWYLRCKELVEKYQPDVLYFDTNELPLGQAGLDVVAHYYNLSAASNGGHADVVVNGKHIEPAHLGSFVEDIERSTANAIRPIRGRPIPASAIGITAGRFTTRSLREGRHIVSMLTDIVSKNGNLMLNIPLRGDGSIDDKEEAFIAGFTAWMDVNSEGIYGTRPWKIYGEGPSTTARPAGRGAAVAARRRRIQRRTFASRPKAMRFMRLFQAWPQLHPSPSRAWHRITANNRGQGYRRFAARV